MSFHKIFQIAILLVLSYAILTGCRCDSNDCFCPSATGLPIGINISTSDTSNYYWIRLDTTWTVVDSVRIKFPPKSSAVPIHSENWQALNEQFNYVVNFEDYSYLLVNSVTQVSDTFSDLSIEHSSNSFECCGDNIVCKQISYLRFNFNGQPIDTSNFPLYFTPD